LHGIYGVSLEISPKLRSFSVRYTPPEALRKQQIKPLPGECRAADTILVTVGGVYDGDTGKQQQILPRGYV
jgi:hypothetical protein